MLELATLAAALAAAWSAWAVSSGRLRLRLLGWSDPWRASCDALGRWVWPSSDGGLRGRLGDRSIRVDHVAETSSLVVEIRGLPEALSLCCPQFGVARVHTGDAVFDRSVEVQMPTSELGWLTQPVRDAALRCGELGVLGLSGGVLELRRSCLVPTRGAIVDLVEASLTLVRALPASADPHHRLAALALSDPIPGVRARSLRILADLSSPTLRRLRGALSDADADVRLTAAALLDAPEVIAEVAADPSVAPATRSRAFRALDEPRLLALVSALNAADADGTRLAAGCATPAICSALVAHCDGTAARLGTSAAHSATARALVAAALRNRHTALADATAAFLVVDRGAIPSTIRALRELGTHASLPALRRARLPTVLGVSDGRGIREAIAAIEGRTSPRGALALANPDGGLALAPPRPPTRPPADSD